MLQINTSFRANNKFKEQIVKTNLNQEKVYFDQCSDVVELNKKNNKKEIGRYVAIGVATTGVLVGGALLATSLIKKGQLLGANKAQKYGKNILEQGEKLKNEVLELFKNGGKKDGVQVANIENGIMTEIAFDGTLMRRATFNKNGNLTLIEVARKNRFDRFEYNKNSGALSGFLKDYTQHSNGEWTAKKSLIFGNKKLLHYEQNCKVMPGKSWEYTKSLGFSGGKLSEYTKGHKQNPSNGSFKSTRHIEFTEGRIYSYKKDYERLVGGKLKFAKRFKFSNGKLTEYVKNYELSPETGETFAKKLNFEKGKPLQNMLVFIKSLFKGN